MDTKTLGGKLIVYKVRNNHFLYLTPIVTFIATKRPKEYIFIDIAPKTAKPKFKLEKRKFGFILLLPLRKNILFFICGNTDTCSVIVMKMTPIQTQLHSGELKN